MKVRITARVGIAWVGTYAHAALKHRLAFDISTSARTGHQTARALDQRTSGDELASQHRTYGKTERAHPRAHAWHERHPTELRVRSTVIRGECEDEPGQRGRPERAPMEGHSLYFSSSGRMV